MWDFLQNNGVKGGFWVWDCILKTGNEKAFEDFLSKGYFRNTYIETNSWHNDSQSMAMFQEGGNKKGTLCGNIDFNNPEAVAHFKNRMKHFFDEGADFIKLDRASEVEVCRTMFEMSQEFGKETKGRGFIMSHSFGTEKEEYKRYPCKWTDDTRSDWDTVAPSHPFPAWIPKVALKENITLFTDPKKKSSQIPFLCNDTGGFDRGSVDSPEEVLFIRWFQFSTFAPVMQLFSQPENPTENLPFRYSERADAVFKTYSHLRMQLFPYIYSNAYRVRLEGKQMIRTSESSTYDFFFGNEFFVAPVYIRGATRREFYLPPGGWINYWTDERLEGGKRVVVDVPLEQIPLFVREGSILPLRKYASSIEAGNNDTLSLHLYPGADGTFTLIEDDGSSDDYLEGKFAKTRITLKKNILKIHPVEGNYSWMKLSRNWKIYVKGNFVGSYSSLKTNPLFIKLK
jgi:alpha-glucosidase (family GH31 glycosyl hydrolase)